VIHKALNITAAMMNTGDPWRRKSLQVSRVLIWKKMKKKGLI